MFEWYDFYLYGLLATIISGQFFSGVNETTGFILALAAFAAGFAVRPFGALVFGRIGDLVGRKRMFTLSVFLMSVPTLLIGLLQVAILVISAYAVTGSIKIANGQIHISQPARRHLAVLLASFLVIIAWDLWLDRYGLVVSGNGVSGAIGYTDAHARQPGMLVLAVLSLAAAGDSASAGVYFLGAYCVLALSLAPFATAAALRISNE